MTKRILYLEGNTDGTVGGSYFLMYDLVKRLDRTKYEPIVGFHTENFLIDRLRADGIEVVVFPRSQPLVFSNRLVNFLLAPVRKVINLYRGIVGLARSQAQFLRERKIDLVNLNNSITRNHSWMLAARWTDTKCITHEMGINRRYSAISRFFGKRLDRIISLSHAIHNAMKNCGIDYPNIQVIHCGIDLTRYQIKETSLELKRKHNIPLDAKVTGVVGNIREWKGQETIVRATALLKGKYPNMRCVLVGECGARDHAYGERINGISRELGVTDNIVLAGFQSNAIDYMEMMDVVAHTSVHPEPFGLVTLEAMSRSKPLVSTTIGGPAEVVVNGESGLLVDPGKPELLAKAIQSLFDDPQKAVEIGRRGYERMKSHFSMQQNLERTMQVYDEILGTTP